jgi:hypothetical protein
MDCPEAVCELCVEPEFCYKELTVESEDEAYVRGLAALDGIDYDSLTPDEQIEWLEQLLSL